MKKPIDYKELKLALARKSLWDYARIRAPKFYKKSRKYLKKLCDGIQDFIGSDDDILIISAPPRHGKSRTGQIAVEWCLGNNHNIKIMTASYNELLATAFSRGVRNAIQEVKADKDKIVYTDIFPGTIIKQGEGAMNLWSLSDGYQNYLATSPTGSSTGFGANLFIVDDLIKSALEANTSSVRDKHWDWFLNTIQSRIEEGGKIIIIMTRWHSDDLAGKVLKELPSFGYRVRQIVFKALQDDGSMLCDEILSRESYDKKVKAMGRDIASANYQQIPIDVVGRLYSKFNIYEDVPKDSTGHPLFSAVKAYIDTADAGADYLCMLIYGVYQNKAYILDVYYTNAAMEITEEETAKRLAKYSVNIADIESNNGGRAFSRNVKRILNTRYPSNKTSVNWFHQAKNKAARILTNSTAVMEDILFPVDWKTRWDDYYTAMYEYQRTGKNAHDDAPDATTGVIEKMNKSNGMRVLR